MHTPALTLSVLGAEIEAVAYQKNSLQSLWRGTAVWNEGDGLAGTLRELLGKAQLEGKEVIMALAHPRLAAQVVEIPPAQGWKLQRLLERQAQSSKTFPGPAVWSWQPALPTKKTSAALLHLLPKATLDQLKQACAQFNLRLIRLLPTSALLSSQLKALPLAKDELGLLVAQTGSGTTIVIGRKDGKVALARALTSNWSTAPDRVWVDLTRSIGFAEQQCGQTVGRVWLFGPDAAAQVTTVHSVLKLPVDVSPVEYRPYYWAEEAARLPERRDGSLISVQDRDAPQRRRMLTATMITLLLLVLLSLGATAALEVARKVDLDSASEIDQLTARLQKRKAEWQKRYVEAGRKKELVRLVSEEKLPPVPAWFLAYLGEAVPDELVLSDFRIVRSGDLWRMHLSGTAQASPGKGGAASTNIAPGLAVLTNRLVTGPFHLQITNCAAGTRAVGSRSPSAPGRLELRSSGPSSGPNIGSRFVIEGMIR